MAGNNTIGLSDQRPERDAGVPHFHLACVRCGGAVRPGQLRCSKCSSDETGVAIADAHGKGLRTSDEFSHRGTANQFSIESLLLVTTLVAVCLGLLAALPPLGVLVSLIAIGALLRTTIAGRQLIAEGLPFPWDEKLSTFALSLFLVFIALSLVVGVLFGFYVVGATMGWLLLDRPPQSAVGQVIHFALVTMMVVGGIAGPPLAGMWFLWATRPR